jgi:Protein of unknown function (DUF1761)
MLNFTNINFTAVFLATVISFIIGSIWYTVFFGKVWNKEVGLNEDQLKNPNYLKTYGGSFVCIFVMISGMALMLKSLGISGNSGWLEGAKTGLTLAITLVAAGLGINYLYQFKSLKLFLIDSIYQTLFLTLGAIILTILS